MSAAVTFQRGVRERLLELPGGKRDNVWEWTGTLISLSYSEVPLMVLSALCQSALCRTLRLGPEIPVLPCLFPMLCLIKLEWGREMGAVKQTLQIVQICFWHLQDSQALSWKYVLAEVTLTNMFLYVYNPRKYLTCLSTLWKDVLASQPSLHSVSPAGLQQG